MSNTKTVGNYLVFYWEPDALGIDGWVVTKKLSNGNAGEGISKHESKSAAIAAAKRYQQGDDRRMS